MKKLSLTAILLNLATVLGTAHAELVLQHDGFGDKLFIPYYSTQSGNVTIVNVTNTEEDAKALKIRFREAQGAESVLNFQVWLSPGDVWSALVGQDAVMNLPVVNFNDTSCTIPDLDQFVITTDRIHTTYKSGDEDEAKKRLREGHIEIIEMASFPAGYRLFNDALHNQNTNPPTPPCQLISTLGTTNPFNPSDIVAPMDATIGTDSAGLYYAAPTGGLMANAILLNVPEAEAMSYKAVALQNINTELAPRYFPQLQTDLGPALTSIDSDLDVADFTLDQKLINGTNSSRQLGGDNFSAQMSDLPDLSTPFEIDLDGNILAGTADTDSKLDTPYEQILGNGTYPGFSDLLLTQNLINDYSTLPEINGATDFVVTMPTKRYHAMGREQAEVLPPFTAIFDESIGQACEEVRLIYFNREETFDDPLANEICPCIPTPKDEMKFCGASSIFAFNMPEDTIITKALEAGQVLETAETIVEINSTEVHSHEGWANFDLTFKGARSGLPVAGFAAMTASSLGANLNTQPNFGAANNHNYKRNGERSITP